MPARVRLGLTLALLVLIGGGSILAGSPTSRAMSGAPSPATPVAPYKLSAGGHAFWSQISPDGSRAVYVENISGKEELYSVPVGGGAPTKLNGPLVNNLGTFFSISPDSRRVIYTARQDVVDQLALYSVPLTGGTAVRLSTGMAPGEYINDAFSFEAGGPAISPDSSRAVYVVRRSGEQAPAADLYSVPVSGGAPVRLSTMQGPGDSIYNPAISADSARAVFLAGGSTTEVYSAPLAGGAPVRLNTPLPPGWTTIDFRISPDGQRVLYVTRETDSFGAAFYSVPIGGGTPTLLDEIESMGSFTIAPDGSRLIYSGRHEGVFEAELLSVPLAGGAIAVLDAGVSWTPMQTTPDSSTVLYTREPSGGQGRALYSVPSAGGTPRRLSGALTPGGDVSVSWSAVNPSFRVSPDGQSVVYVADQDVDEQFELYSVPIGGGAPAKLNGPLPPWGDTSYDMAYPSQFLISADSTSVVYIADQGVDEQFELYSVPIGGGSPARINGPMTAGGDISHFTLTPDGARVLYEADQELDEKTELYGAGVAGGAPAPTPIAPTPIAPTPGPGATPSPVPGNDERPAPARPGQSRTAGAVTVYADRFDGTASEWTATGTVWIGPHTVVESAEVRFSRGALGGTGLVSVLSAADGSRRTTLFSGGFDVSGERLVPRGANFEPRLNNLAGFRLLHDGLQLWVDVAHGRLHGTGSLQIVAPGNVVKGAVDFQLGRDGALSGEARDAVLQLGYPRLKILAATLGSDGLSIVRSELQLGAGLGGGKAEIQTTIGVITGDGRFVPAQAIYFPNLRVGGVSGFGIDGARASLTVEGGVYRFAGAGTFVLPGMGPPSPEPGGARADCKVGVRFALANRPPPIRNAGLSIEGCVRVPIGSTGFFLTEISGEVSLDENSVAVDLGVGIEGGPEIPVVGVALRGDASAHWDNSWKVALRGSVKVFSFEAGEAALALSRARGLEGEIRIKLAGALLDGEGNLRIWRDTSGFHVTGSQRVVLQVEKGEIFERCFHGACLSIPLSTYRGPSASADFGEFRRGDETVYGVKGRVELIGYTAGFFADARGDLRFGKLDEYLLASSAGASAAQAGGELRTFEVAPGTPTLLVGAAATGGAPEISLTAPDGRTLGVGSPGVTASASLTQTLLAVADPQPGRWQAAVSGLGDGEYVLSALGARPAAAVAPPTVTANGDGSYAIGLSASSAAPTSTISLFVDSSASARTGQAIVQGLPLTTTSYTWRAEGLASGTYYVYAMVDDPLGAPAFAYATAPISYSDRTPPATPAGLAVVVTGTGARTSWRPGTEPDLAGYKVYYTEPGGGTTFIADIPDGGRDWFVQEGLYLNGAWNISIAAYDLSGNESARSPAQVAIIRLNTLHLPLIRR